MNRLRENTLTLIADLQRFLLQEYHPKEWIFADSENFAYFKTHSATSIPEKPRTASLVTPSSPVYPRKPVPRQPIASAPLPEVVEKKSIETPAPKTSFRQEPLGKAQAADLTEMRKLVAETFPKWEIVEPPSFQEKVAPVLILASTTNSLLMAIGQAIQNQLMPIQVLDPSLSERVKKALNAKGIKLVLIDEISLRTDPFLLSLYRPNLELLGVAPVIVLKDPTQLAQDPQRKRAVWNQIKEKLT